MQLAELMVLSTFAVGQPLLDLLGSTPDFFLLRNSPSRHITVVALAVLLLPGFVAWAGVQVARPFRLGEAVHHGALSVFGALLAVQVLKMAVGAGGAPLVVVAAVLGVGFAFVRHRSPVLRQVLHVAAIAPVLSGALFFFASPTSELIAGHTVAVDGAFDVDRPDDVVVLMADEFPLATILRDGEIDAEHFPNFARLAATSTWFDQATGVAGATKLALPAMLASERPVSEGRPPIAAEYPRTLFTMLAPTYEQHVYETLTGLCPSSACTIETTPPTPLRRLLGEVGAIYRDIVSPGTPDAAPGDRFAEFHTDPETGPEAFQAGDEFNATRDVDEHSSTRFSRFEAFLEGLGPSAEPRLDFYHLLLPHVPFTSAPDGRHVEWIQVAGGTGSYLADPDYLEVERPYPARILMLQHYEQARYVDRLLGRLIDRMEAVGTWDDANFLFLSDHGLKFGGVVRDYHPRAAGTLVGVPFFVKASGQTEGDVVSSNVQTIDLLPTIADLLGVDPGWDFDGRSAYGEPRPGDERSWYWGGETVEFDTDDYLPATRRGLVSMLGSDPDGPGGYRAIGPRPELIGTAVPADLPAPVGSATVSTPEAVERGATEDAVQIAVTGEVSGVDGVAGAVGVAYALDGTIVATSEIYTVDDQDRWAVVVDPDLVPAGPTAWSAYAIAGDGLVPLGVG